MTDAQRIDVDASDWAVRLHSGQLSEMQRDELTRWLEADSRHRGALLRAQVVWEDLDRLAALATGTQLGGEPPSIRRVAVSTGEVPAPPTLIAVQTASGLSKRITLGFAVAAGLVMVVGVLLYFRLGAQSYSTPLGRTDRVRLEDGSEVTLNTDTRIRVQLRNPERRIELDNGEALFKVAKDPERPFIVHVGTLSVRAIGTTFAVRRGASRTDIMVTEGVVELTDQSEAAVPPPQLILANQRATVVESRNVAIQKYTPETMENQLAWADAVVRFTGEPLATAIAELNRHNRIQIVVDDPVLAARPVAGTFKLTDPTNFAATIAIALGVQQARQDETIHLHR